MMAFGVGVVSIVPLLMIYVAVCDELDKRAMAKSLESAMEAWAGLGESRCVWPVATTSDLAPHHRESRTKAGIRLQGEKIVFDGYRKRFWHHTPK
jgi:hypothetical protein